jgi:UDP-N-acetylmuramyl pentapeptide phosphotransferase/UDP-N-acetylglucosamine-1-phosphate transferase
LIYLTIFLASALLVYLFIRISHRYSIFIDCHKSDKPQRFHDVPIPRIGGIGIFVASALSLFSFGAFVFASAFFAFFSGILEDFTGRVSQRIRLVIQTIGAGIFVLIGGVYLHTIGLGFQFPYIIAVILTIFAIVGVTNAVNIIDGLNGLASGVSLSAFGIFAYFTYSLGDSELFGLCMTMIFATLGFFVFNFPRSRVFLGDGGAYFLGFMLACIAILIVDRHNVVSAWFCLSIVIYPIWEVIYSIIRRLSMHGTKATVADKMHLHQVLMRRLRLSNPKASLVIVFAFLPFQIAGLLFYDHGFILFGVIVTFIAFYQFSYSRLTIKNRQKTKGAK